MFIMHVALGGCLTAPVVDYGLTEDTGGHIAYVIGAAMAQARRADVSRVEIVTRAFDAPELGAIYADSHQIVGPKIVIRRLGASARGYLSKEALAAELPEIEAALLADLRNRDQRPDVIHAHFADAARIGAAVRREMGVRLVYTPHSLGVDKQLLHKRGVGPQLAARIAQEREAIVAADAVVVSSRDEAERQIAAYNADACGQVWRISPGVPRMPEPAADLGSGRALIAPFLTDPDKPIILAIARPVRRKNLGALARVFRDTHGLAARANLVILAGQHGLGRRLETEAAEVVADLQAITADPALLGRIALPPAHGAQEVAELYRLAAVSRGVFVNPALHEPFGLTLLEAAHFGLPVVATREGGPADILATINHGALIDPTDPAALATGLAHLLEDPAAWDRAASAAARIHTMYAWDAWAARAQKAYRQICRAATRGRTAPPRRLLASDIDDTLTGCARTAGEFAVWAARRDLAFAVATGRSITEARRVLADWDLPEPDLFITAVGSEIHRRDRSGRLRLCRDYAEHLSQGWDREAVLAIARASGLGMQADVEQRRWKISLYGAPAQARRLETETAAGGLAVRVIASHGNLIDVLPRRGGKGAAMAFAAGQLGLSPADCIAAGDSNNDRDMFEVAGAAIIVGNALPELDDLTDGDRIFRARRSHAGGVLEGLARLGLAAPGTATKRLRR